MSNYPEKYHAVFEPGSCYHVYNCTNNREQLFLSDENSFFFLRQYAKYISPFADTFAYNLLPNHFHFVCCLHSLEKIKQYVESVIPEKRLKSETAFLQEPEKYFDLLIEAEFHRFFTSYSMAFNKMYARKGNLFQRGFKRLLIANDEQLCQALVYVHANAVKHQLVKGLTDHPFTSYHLYLSDSISMIEKKYVLDLFGGKESFIKFHQEQTKYYYDDPDFMDEQ